MVFIVGSGSINMSKCNFERKRIKTPHTYALLLIIIIFSSVLTYLIPAGEYAREKGWANFGNPWII